VDEKLAHMARRAANGVAGAVDVQPDPQAVPLGLDGRDAAFLVPGNLSALDH
jgi:hypothetical protein